MEHPWENVDAFGNTTRNIDRAPFVKVAHKTTHVNPDDTAQVEFVEIRGETKLSVVVLSNNCWTPVWIKDNSLRTIITGFADVLTNRYYNVMLILNGESTNVWMDEKELSKFTWEKGF